jgi:hypothetical protein
MSLLKNRSMRFYLVFFLILTMAIGGSAIAAFADSGGATATVNAGQLSETGTFGESVSTTLDGTDQTVPYTLPIKVTDARGGSTGWNLQISGTPLSDGTGDTLIQQVSAATIACAGPSTCSTPTTGASITYPVVISGSASKFFSVGSARGIFDVTTTVQALVPGNAFAGTYTTTLTLASVAGP